MRFLEPIYAVPHVSKMLKHAAKMRQKSELCGGYAAKNCTYAVIMRIQNQSVRLCCYGAANWRALKVKRWARVKIAVMIYETTIISSSLASTSSFEETSS